MEVIKKCTYTFQNKRTNFTEQISKDKIISFKKSKFRNNFNKSTQI